MKLLDPNQPAAVYRHINAAGETIYIGCSINPMARFDGHRSQSPWATEVSNIAIRWFADHKEALAEELRLIKKEKPRYNRQVNRGPRVWADTVGAKYLIAWMKSASVTNEQLARALDEPLATTNKLFSERARPQAKRRCRLSVISEGFVPSGCWHTYAYTQYSPVAVEDAAADAERSQSWLERHGFWVPTPLGQPFQSEARAA